MRLPWSSSPFPTSNSYFPLYPDFHNMKIYASFLALMVAILKPPGQHLSDKSCCKLPWAITITQTTQLKSAKELHLSIFLHLRASTPAPLLSLLHFGLRNSTFTEVIRSPFVLRFCFPLTPEIQSRTMLCPETAVQVLCVTYQNS